MVSVENEKIATQKTEPRLELEMGTRSRGGIGDTNGLTMSCSPAVRDWPA